MPLIVESVRVRAKACLFVSPDWSPPPKIKLGTPWGREMVRFMPTEGDHRRPT